MLRVLEDDGLRAELVAKGLARAADFSWEETARQTHALFAEIVTGQGAALPEGAVTSSS